MTNEIIVGIISAVAAILGIFIGSALTVINDWFKLQFGIKEHNRQKREETYKNCIEFCNRLNYDKQTTVSNVDKVMGIRAGLDLYASEDIKKQFQNIADKILRPDNESQSEAIKLLINTMRKELGIKD